MNEGLLVFLFHAKRRLAWMFKWCQIVTGESIGGDKLTPFNLEKAVSTRMKRAKAGFAGFSVALGFLSP